ncbi:MAG: DUF4236 domain-containing protein [Firmicutes bacterium]|nr:DUF4236 domain-containing protein [Bacillota bacterium]
MATRFRKSIKVAPGVKVNLNKKSASMTIGTKGAHITKSTNGSTTKTAGIPGSGLSYVDRKSGSKPAPKTHEESVSIFDYIEEPVENPSFIFGVAYIKIISGIDENIAKKIVKVTVMDSEISFKGYDQSTLARLQLTSLRGVDFYSEEVTGKILKTPRKVYRFKLKYETKKGNIKEVVMQPVDLSAFGQFFEALKEAVAQINPAEE